MDEIPKITHVETYGESEILVCFSNGNVRNYNIKQNPKLAPLLQDGAFHEAKIDPAGIRISWDDEYDLSGHEILVEGQALK